MKKIAYCGEFKFGEMIKTQRLAKDLSINGLADLTGFSGAAISRWESGKRIPSV